MVRRGHRDRSALGMLSGTVCGLLMLFRDLAVALVIDGFLPPALLPLGSNNHLLVNLRAHDKTLVVVLPMVPLGIRARDFDTLA